MQGRSENLLRLSPCKPLFKLSKDVRDAGKATHGIHSRVRKTANLFFFNDVNASPTKPVQRDHKVLIAPCELVKKLLRVVQDMSHLSTKACSIYFIFMLFAKEAVQNSDVCLFVLITGTLGSSQDNMSYN